MKKWIKRALIGFAIFFVLLIVFIGCIFFDLIQIAKADQAYQQRMEQNPPTLNKNDQGEYRMIVRLGEDARTLTQRNPNFFETNEYGGYEGLGFMRPRFIYDTNFSSDDISKIRLELLDEDYELALYLNGFKTDIMLASENEPLNVGFLRAILKSTGNIYRVMEASEAFDNEVNKIQNTTYLSDEEKAKQIDAITQAFEEQEKRYEIEASKKRYQQYQDILAVLKKYAWKPYIPLYSPRVLGKDSWLLKNDNEYSYLTEGDGDGRYIDNYEKWQKYVENDDIFVLFYRKNLLLQLSISDSAPFLEIETNTSNYLNREDDKWMEKLAADIPKWQAKRKEAEDILRAQGYTIDESYVDAPLPKVFLTWQASQQSHK